MTIQRRLQTCMKRGNLRVADLARWFGRPHPTVRGWTLLGIRPGGGPHDIERVHKLLEAMEFLIKRRKGFPLPQMTPRERKLYILGLKKGYG
jgi:hypothetical protein